MMVRNVKIIQEMFVERERESQNSKNERKDEYKVQRDMYS